MPVKVFSAEGMKGLQFAFKKALRSLGVRIGKEND
jgi:hypothetical protein